MTRPASMPLTDSLDPSKPYSLVSLRLADLPEEVIGSPTLRRLTLVKTLSGAHGLVTEVQQFKEASVTGIRSIDGAIEEFNVGTGEAAVLHVLERVPAFDVATRRLALMRIFRDDPVRASLLEDCAALHFDSATRSETEALTEKYTQALFADVFTESEKGSIKTVADLITHLDKASASANPAERKRAKSHLLDIQRRFQLRDISGLIPFFSDFELLVTAIGHYRRCFLGLLPHMRLLDGDTHSLSRTADQTTTAMLTAVSRYLGQTVTWIERFFVVFDESFDKIIASAEPQTFKRLQENLQRGYAAIGALLCGWGLRIQAVDEFLQRQNRNPRAAVRIAAIREFVCKHLHEGSPDFDDLNKAIGFLREASHG
jgi:hypothetical protein